MQMILYLHSVDPLVGSYILLDEKKRIVQSENEIALATFKNKEVIVIIPAEDVLLTKVNLPKLSRARLLQALPFALEEMLLDDVDNLHFAMGPKEDDLSVAVIAKEKMTQWLEALKKINIYPKQMLSAVFMLPTAEKMWTVNEFLESCTVRTGLYSGFAVEKNNLEILLSSSQNEKEIYRSVHSPLALLQKNFSIILQGPAINLLQGVFRPRQPKAYAKKVWLMAGILACTSFFVLLLGQMGSWIFLTNEIKQNDLRILKIYQHYFPLKKTIVSARQDLQEKYKQLLTAANKNNLLTLLSAIGKSFSGTTNLHLDTLELIENHATLSVSAQSFDELDQFTQSLSQLGFHVEKQNASAEANNVKATLQITVEAA